MRAPLVGTWYRPRVEKSTDQVIRPVYLDSLAAWVGKIPNKAVQKMDKLAPMLKVLGYDPWANPPNYTHPPDGVADNSLHTGANADFWRDQEPDTFDTRPEDDVEGDRGKVRL
nr:hypothetical protein BaRGS_019650 [Batillaria attramentaria]